MLRIKISGYWDVEANETEEEGKEVRRRFHYNIISTAKQIIREA